jgi:hypothetical protein
MGRLRQYITSWTRWLWSALDGLVFRKGGAKRYWAHVLIKLRISGFVMLRYEATVYDREPSHTIRNTASSWFPGTQ